ncbi:MAG: hypothetical protein LBR43_02555 [Spiroplasmataceae bacterium]|jgi:hypothetical protein|nr:hypothetical protein [Spiroplasmataceae bacterium]
MSNIFGIDLQPLIKEFNNLTLAQQTIILLLQEQNQYLKEIKEKLEKN